MTHIKVIDLHDGNNIRLEQLLFFDQVTDSKTLLYSTVTNEQAYSPPRERNDVLQT